MNRSEIAISVIARVTGAAVQSISPETELVADLDMDSAKALELLVELEDRFEVEIDDEEAANLNTVGDVLAAVDALGAPPRDPEGS
jgi:acyl carrier protein